MGKKFYKVLVNTLCENVESIFQTHFSHNNRRFNYSEDWEEMYLTEEEIKKCLDKCIDIKMLK